MLSLPRKLIFGDQHKLNFKLDEVNGIARLYSERHIPYHDPKYWSRFLQFDSPTDIFSLLSLADIRKARQHAPENVVTLVRVMVAHLESLVVDPHFSPTPKDETLDERLSSRLNGITDVSRWRLPGASLVGLDGGADRSSASAPQDQRDRTREVLNVVRILTRTLPAVMESIDSDFEAQVLWSQSPEAYAESSGAASASNTADKSIDNAAAAGEALADTTATQFVIDDDEDDEDANDDDGHAKKQEESQIAHPLAAEPEAKHPPEDPEDIPVALGERLVRLAVDLLFYSGFSIPWTEDQIAEARRSPDAVDRVNYSIWEAGVGSSVDLSGTTRQHVSNRVEVLRLLLVLLSKSMYISAEKQPTTVDPALKFAVQDLERSVMLPLLCSLINTSISNARNSTSAWLGLSPSVTGLVGGTNDEVRTSLVTLSLEILTVLLTYDAPIPGAGVGDADTVSLSTIGAPQPGPAGRNVFRFYLSKLHRSADFDFLWSGFARYFNEHVHSTVQILAIPIPTGQGRRAAEARWHLNQVAERLILLWRLLEHNAKFRAFVLDDSKRALQLLSYLVFFAVNYKANVALQGVVRLCSFVLQDVSSDAAFSLQLSKPGSGAKVSLPTRLGLVGGSTGIDFLVQAVYVLIATTKGQLSSLYAPLLISLANTAPRWRLLSITSSNRLMHLLRSFAQPSFLLTEEGNPRLLFYLLESINAALTCQYDANPNLVYSLVLSHSVLDNLHAFTLRRGVLDIWNRRRSRGTDSTDWFENAPRLEKPPLPPQALFQQSSDADAMDKTRDVGSKPDSPPTSTSAVDKGKMRRISTSGREWEGELSVYPLEVVEEVAARYIGKHGFRPTQAWVESWKTGLPVSTARFVVGQLLPRITEIASHGRTSSSSPSGGAVSPSGSGAGMEAGKDIEGGSTDVKVLAFLREQRLQEQLPTPREGIHARPWNWSIQAHVWLRSFLWGSIYVEALLPFGIWSDTDIQLFRIHDRPEPRPRDSRTVSQTNAQPSAPASTASSSTLSATATGTGKKTSSAASASAQHGEDVADENLSKHQGREPETEPASQQESSAPPASSLGSLGSLGSVWSSTKELGKSLSRSSTPKASSS
ncbi:hypothetical protein BCV70DRAFT_191120 [Testicularia cyperi]|uniref:Uncharacterized protein n=1 Tax=Testicularia cyperi TaxID=1882483 RepID=A0A317XN20_9BASI|nr:hypothetical protein BCV70DRAFT_191120 [Testicularia cyperi]